jgi:hypothetical protein
VEEAIVASQKKPNISEKLMPDMHIPMQEIQGTEQNY